MTSKTTAWIGAKLRGENPATPPDTASQRPDKMMAAAIGDKLKAGPRAPGDAVDQQANDQNAQTAEEEARAKLDELDPEIIVAIDDPADPSHATAVRLLAAYVALVTIGRKKAAQP